MQTDLFMYPFLDEFPAAYCIAEVLLDEEGAPADIIYKCVNKAYVELKGLPGTEIVGKSFLGVDSKRNKRWLDIFYKTAYEGAKQEIQKYIPSVQKYFKVSLYQLEEGVCGCLAESMSGYMDPLVGCLNYSGFKRCAEQVLQNHPEDTFAFLSFDIKQFNYINETQGYEEGNRILRELGKYLMSELDEKELLGRISGDNFVLLTCVSDMENWKKRDEEYRKALIKILKGKNRSAVAGISGGLYVRKPEERSSMDVNRMLDYANLARKKAKRQKGSRIEFFNEAFWEREKRAVEISQHLQEAMENGEIQPWFQPQYDYRKGKMIGAEVLARWTHPVYGQIFPTEFIPVLEETGQISEMDYYIWEAACRCMRKWLDEGKRIPLSINISRRDTLEEGLLEQLTGLAERYGLERDMLHLEITESAYMEEPDELIAIVQKLKDAGFSVAMDDFGSGYSSLNMLKEVSVETIKLDLRFLTDVEHNAKAGNVISSVVRMAHAMEMVVIAEGVETRQQAEFLKNLGCDLMQGYYFAKPLPQDEFEQCSTPDVICADKKIVQGQSMENIREFLITNNNTSFIFNRCVGAAAILEYTGEAVQIILANDRFYELNGGLDDDVRVNNGAVQSRKFSGEDIERVHDTIRHTMTKGSAKCKVYMKSTGLWLELRYNLISRIDSTALLFCQMENVTKEYELQKELEKVKTEMQMNLDLMPGGTFKYESDGEQHFEYISNGILTMLGYSSLDEFRRKCNNSFIEMIYEADRERVLREIDEQLAVGDTDYCEYRIETADGALKWVYDRGRLVVDEQGKRWCYGLISDIDERKRLENRMHWQRQQFQALAQMPGAITFDYDPETDLLTLDISDKKGRVSRILEERFLEDIHEHSWMAEESADAHKKAYEEAIGRPVTGSVEFLGRFEGEEYHWYRSHYTSVADDFGKVYRIVGRADLIDSDMKRLKSMRDKAEHDSLTGLLNQYVAMVRIEQKLERYNCGTVFMIDVDNFKMINDTCGHLAGNEALKRIAEVLRTNFRKEDVVGRFGGDEFVVFSPNVSDPDWAENKAGSLLEKINSIEIAEGKFLHVSVGVAIEEGRERSSEQLLKKADEAMYQSKVYGRNTFTIC